MAVVRKSLEQLSAEKRRIDLQKLAATSEDEIFRQQSEDDENFDGSRLPQLVIPVQAVRQKLCMTQAEFARNFKIPLGTIRNWEQNRVTPDPAARALLTILFRQPEAALKAFLEPA